LPTLCQATARKGECAIRYAEHFELGKKMKQEHFYFDVLDRGVPCLRSKKNKKTMHVHWGDGTLWDYLEFAAFLDADGMNAALRKVWEDCKPQCGRRAQFCYGGVHGCMVYVPIDAGLAAVEIVYRYFTEALDKIAKPIVKEEMLISEERWRQHEEAMAQRLKDEGRLQIYADRQTIRETWARFLRIYPAAGSA